MAFTQYQAVNPAMAMADLEERVAAALDRAEQLVKEEPKRQFFLAGYDDQGAVMCGGINKAEGEFNPFSKEAAHQAFGHLGRERMQQTDTGRNWYTGAAHQAFGAGIAGAALGYEAKREPTVAEVAAMREKLEKQRAYEAERIEKQRAYEAEMRRQTLLTASPVPVGAIANDVNPLAKKVTVEVPASTVVGRPRSDMPFRVSVQRAGTRVSIHGVEDIDAAIAMLEAEKKRQAGESFPAGAKRATATPKGFLRLSAVGGPRMGCAAWQAE